jgi:hypothetical protein
MEHHVTDDLERRLRAARPRAARPDEGVFDEDLLARVRAQPVAARRGVPRAVALPVAAGVTLTATAVVMLGGGPGDVGGPSSAAAISQALRWLDPPADTVLHVRSTEDREGHTRIREFWQSSDDPAAARERDEDALETAGDAFYDPATDTIYDPPSGAGKPGDPAPFVADPIVVKVRMLLSEGRMTVTGREDHDGTDAWAISLKPGAGRPVWTLWVSAEDGRPLELRDPGRNASEAPQVIRWQTYEVLPEDDAGRLTTLTGAHPSARVSDDPAQATARGRLMPDQPGDAASRGQSSSKRVP